MDTPTTDPRHSETTCFRCNEPFVKETLYLIYMALMTTSDDDKKPLADRLLDAPAALVYACGDCVNAGMGGHLKPSLRISEEDPGAIRLTIKTSAPSSLIPDGYRPGDTVGYPTGGSR